jgi:hypothetical protein
MLEVWVSLKDLLQEVALLQETAKSTLSTWHRFVHLGCDNLTFLIAVLQDFTEAALAQLSIEVILCISD